MQQATLSAHGLSKIFGHGSAVINVLKNISFESVQGKTCAITGVSGTGKSTLMHILAGLDEPTSGSVVFNEKSLSLMTPIEQKRFRSESIGLVFQQPYLVKELSVLENCMLPGLLAGKERNDCVERTQELLQTVGLGEKALHKPATLSGGQQQRLALARALFNKPVFLLADEPTGNLDIATGKAMVDLLLQWQKEWNMGIIVSTHDTYVAESMQEQFQLQDGRLLRIR